MSNKDTRLANRTLVYPGSFDPITFGHIDLLHRATQLFDHTIIAVSGSSTVKQPMFALSERIELVKKVVQKENIANKVEVEVEGFNSLLVDFMRTNKTRFLLRGLRTLTDFEFEFQLANVNRLMYPEIETVFLMPDEGFAYISSSLVREIALLNGDISKFVPPLIATALRNKVAERQSSKS